MSGLRLGLAAPGATARALLDLGRLAERAGVATLWTGDPRRASPRCDDTYALMSLAALGASTEDLRLGAFLTLRASASVLRVAEDLAVADRISGGRVAMALVPPDDDDRLWADDVRLLCGAWKGWPLPTGGAVPVTPGPGQPVLPRLVVGDHPVATEIGAGRLIIGENGSGAPNTPPHCPEPVAVLVDVPAGGVAQWLGTDPLAIVKGWRRSCRALGASELVLCAPEWSARDLKALAAVGVPALRAADADVEALVDDSWRWLTERDHLHDPWG